LAPSVAALQQIQMLNRVLRGAELRAGRLLHAPLALLAAWLWDRLALLRRNIRGDAEVFVMCDLWPSLEGAGI